jgi:hypothetical protein
MSSKTDPRNKTFTSAKKAYNAWLEGRSYVAATAELRRSLAWRHRTNSRYAVRLIDRLEVEHCQHNGRENGYLKLTWRQMLEAGISNDFINPTIAFVAALGLVTVTHKGSYRAGANSDPSMFQLNYLPWKLVPATGAPLYYAPTDEWAKYDGSAVLKSPRKKSFSSLHPDGANGHPPGGAKPHRQKPGLPQNVAPANAPPGWWHSSRLRLPFGGGGSPGNGSPNGAIGVLVDALPASEKPSNHPAEKLAPQPFQPKRGRPARAQPGNVKTGEAAGHAAPGSVTPVPRGTSRFDG